MEFNNAEILAGSLSSLIFICGTLTMVIKAMRTKEMDSYSGSSLLLNNLGNMLHWVYVLSLPPGPIYVLHGFYTVATLFMMAWYMLYHTCPELSQRISQSLENASHTIPESVRHTLEMPTMNQYLR